MTFNFYDQQYIPEDSYSRVLDRRVAMDEFPYGYSGGEPPQGHHNTAMRDEHYKKPKLKRAKPAWAVATIKRKSLS